jgi:hypothetical protein
MWGRQRRDSLTGEGADVIPHSEIAGAKPPYVCPGCSIHTYSNNMINRFHVKYYKYLFITK